MCIVIDLNTLPIIFNSKNASHEQYHDVLEWIIKGKGTIIYGGTKYMTELKRTGSYLKLLRLLKEKGKAKELENDDREAIDMIEEELIEIVKDDDFDDPHIIAILIVSRCVLICSDDKRSYKYIKNKKLFPRSNVPKIVNGSSLKNKKRPLLSEENIVEICKPCIKLKKSTASSIIDTI